MKVNNNLNTEVSYDFNGMPGTTKANEYGEFSEAITKSEEQDGEFLGLTMLPEKGKYSVYGMRAMLSSQSTPDNPIVQVVSNLDGKREVFDIEINKIDPANASRMEMFALCCYEDKYGTGTGSTFGSFHTLRMYEETAYQNGYRNRADEDMSVWDQFKKEKVDWIQLTASVLDNLRTVKDSRAIDLYLKGQRLRDLCAKQKGNVRLANTEDSGAYRQEAYERLSGPGKAITDAERALSLGGLSPGTKVTEIGVASLPSGVSFYFNEDTGEVSCVDHKDNRPGRHVLWSKHLSPEDRKRCDKLFDSYKDVAAGGFVFRYGAYLRYEEFWDRYLEGKVDLAALIQKDDTLSEDEIYDQFLRDVEN